jgi:UTP--glucose-1-phosphate uridylyltransferase
LGKDEPRYDIGNFESYFKAFVDFALADERVGDSLRCHLEEVLRVDHP